MNTTKTAIDTKTIDIEAMEWFDKVNGNSYFAANVIVNYGLPNAFSFALPFQYGYGDHYKHQAFVELSKRGYLPNFGERDVFWRYCDDHNIILRTHKAENCKKRDLKAIC